MSKAAAISSVTIRNLCKKLKDAKIASFADPKIAKTVKSDRDTYNITTKLRVKNTD